MSPIDVKELLPGDPVVVRSEAEILSTLDGDGTLDGLPFMPEMRSFCGGHFRVAARADRTVHDKLGVRRMKQTVHLEDLRCDGAAHDRCDRGCLIFWKEAWLRRTLESARPTVSAAPSLKTADQRGYFCQATQLAAASERMPLLDLRPDLRAPVTEGLSPLVLVRSIAIHAHDLLQRRLGGREWNAVAGRCTKTPVLRLGLQPGDRVRVKSKREVLATLDANGWNRGMEFSREMLPYCGREAVVLRRVDRIIRDHTARLINLKDTVILDGAVYRALNRRAVPRRELMFWRECWLERT